MPINVECEICFETFSVPDKYEHKKIKCKHCSSPVVVPGQTGHKLDKLAPTTSSSKHSTSSRTRKTTKKKRTPNKPIPQSIIGLAAAIFATVALMVVTKQFPSIRPQDSRVLTWALEPDPGTYSLTLPEQIDTNTVFSGDCNRFVATETPSPFILTGLHAYGISNGSVFDLSKQQNIGTAITSEISGQYALSPDGKTVAVVSDSDYAKVTIFSTKTGRVLHSTRVAEGSPTFQNLVYRNSDELVYIARGNIEKKHQFLIRIISVLDGNIRGSIYDDAMNTNERFAISPRGRFIVFYGHKLSAYDLTNVRRAGELKIPIDTLKVSVCAGLTFNQSGTILYGLFEHPHGMRIGVFDALNGKLMETIKTSWPPYTLTSFHLTGSVLQELQNGKYFLIRGQLLLERQSQRIIWVLNIRPERTNYAPRYIHENRMLTFAGEQNQARAQEIKIDLNTLVAHSKAAFTDSSALIKPDNATISVKLNISQVRHAEEDAVWQKIMEVIKKQLVATGLTLADNSPQVLSINYSEAPGNTLTHLPYHRNPNETLPQKQATKFNIDYQLSISDNVVLSRSFEMDPMNLKLEFNMSDKDVRDLQFIEAYNHFYRIPFVWYADLNSPANTLPQLHLF